MVPGGLTESIWHFAGHFRIIHDIARDRIDYDPSQFRAASDDYVTQRPQYDYNPDFQDLDSYRVPGPLPAPFEELETAYRLPVRLRQTSEPEPDFDSTLGFPGSPIRFGGGGGGGGRPDHTISVTYEPGGQQTQLEINQYNLLSDSDLFLQGNGSTPAIMWSIEQLSGSASAVLQAMADDANGAIPSEWWFPQSGQGFVEFLQTSDAARDGVPAENAVEPGYYLNGVLQDPAPEPPLPSLELPERPEFGEGVGQFAEAGNNTSFNAALIVDLSESGRTMVVMGDYYSTNAIFQTNSIVDKDHIETAGGAMPAVALAGNQGENTTDNIADFVEHPGIYAEVPAFFAGYQWHVDVVDGDYYSIHLVTQTNLLLDDDAIVQSASDAHYEAFAGANGQINLTEVFDGTIQYDLIIVEGAYHGMNVIYQNNILLDNDVVQQFADALNSGHAVDSSGNQLVNAATIETFGDDNFGEVGSDLQQVVDAVGSGQTSLDPIYGTYFAGSGGTINVLYVKGDYYDVNAIYQTNVTSDVDVILQLIDESSAKASADPDDPGSQSASTGQNNLTNEAAIVDVGATETYVNGEVYTDTILVQVNLLPTDTDGDLNKDTATLVTELVAFVDDVQDEPPAAYPLASQPADDAVANILH